MPLINPSSKLDEILEKLSLIENIIKDKLEKKKATRKRKNKNTEEGNTNE